MQHKVITAGALNFKMATSHLINVCEDVIIAGALISKWLPPIWSMFVKVINGIEDSNAKSTKLDAKRLAENQKNTVHI